MIEYVWLIPLFPAIGFLINGLISRWYNLPKAFIAWVACSALALSFIGSAAVFFELLKLPPELRVKIPDVILFDWVVSGDLRTVIGYKVDPLSMVMALVVTGVSFLIHVYSVGYMHKDPGFARYFSYLNLFVFMMLNLVLANNFLLMFLGWEGVGLCSYLLIGFWFENEAPPRAGLKAFIVNRVGDFGFLIGLFLIFSKLGTLIFDEVFAKASALDPWTVTLITLMLFVGATGKSAQLPLYVWLPDAMEGPTPVSSLIHAATMVTAGVYMVARCHVLYEMAPLSMMVVATVGALTAIFAASMALVQVDFKRILAYSTISQLGYMFLAVGVGAYSAGIFHLMTHAFFKALLFLAAGSVMHALAGELDIRRMGQLKEKMPITFWTFLLAALAIAGIPGFSGFFSKDEILWNAFSSPKGHAILWLIGLITAGMTAFYMFRLCFMAFFGRFRGDHEVFHHAHESPPIMTIPMIVLAVLSVIGGYVGIPHVLGGHNYFHEFLSPVFKLHENLPHGEGSEKLELLLMVVSVAVALFGIFLAFNLYLRNPELPKKLSEKWAKAYKILWNKYYVDEIYGFIFVEGTKGFGRILWHNFDEAVIDRTVNWIGSLMKIMGAGLRLFQTGFVRDYILGILVGALILMLLIL
jgi:NADH-quinone oxidoreductase subunit L